jgi:hypothetical protein
MDEPYDSTESYRRAVARREGKGMPFFPSPEEVRNRIAMLTELRELGFNELFITSVMAHDTPNIDVVRRMVARYGAAETYRRCRDFLAIPENEEEP